MSDRSLEPLKLVAFDEADLEVLSAHLQDAVIRVADMKYLRAEQRFVLVANRFDWGSADTRKPRQAASGFRRRRTGLHFERVQGVRAKSLNPEAHDAVVELLAIKFEAGQPPSGTITLYFAGGSTIRLDVECVDAQMRDLGPVWETSSLPQHDLAAEDDL